MSWKLKHRHDDLLCNIRRDGVISRLVKALTHVSIIVIAASSLSIASVAKADNLILNGMALNPAVTGQVTGVSPTIFVGGYSGAWNGDPFFAFCVDLAQSISFQTNYSDYSRVALNSVFTLAEISDMTKLFNIHYGDSQANASNSAAFQFALWEIVTETSGLYRLNSGTFEAVSSSSGAAVSTANLWLTELAGASGGALELTLFHSPTQQDLITISALPKPIIPSLTPFAIPEPPAYLVTLLALGLLGLTRVRTKRGAKQIGR